MRRGDLPADLGRTFTTVDAGRRGVSASRLRAGDLELPFRGVRTRTTLVDESPNTSAVARREHELRTHALAYALVMPIAQFFTHLTAALFWGVPLPPSLILKAPLAPDVGVMSPGRAPRNRAVRGHEVAVQLAHIVSHPTHRVRVASPASTWAMLGALVPDIRDLVAAGDALVREKMFAESPKPLASKENLAAAIDSGRRVGIASLREALPLIRTRSASRPETWLRLALVQAGLPEPALNWTLTVDGRTVACIDLAYPGRKIAIEYEGGHHLTDDEQWNTDIARYENLVAAGWFVIRVTKDQLFGDPASIVARVRRAIADRQ